MKKVLIITALVCVAWTGFSFAGEIDTYFMGLSYHFQKNGAKKDAPNRLDSNGQWVLNPGLAIGYDFRRDRNTPGLSGIVQAGFFEDCAVNPFYFGGAGGRYRKFFGGKMFWEVKALELFGYGKDWEDNSKDVGFLTYLDAGIGHDFGKFLTTIGVAYVPKKTGNGITDGTDMLFVHLEVSF